MPVSWRPNLTLQLSSPEEQEHTATDEGQKSANRWGPSHASWRLYQTGVQSSSVILKQLNARVFKMRAESRLTRPNWGRQMNGWILAWSSSMHRSFLKPPDTMQLHLIFITKWPSQSRIIEILPRKNPQGVGSWLTWTHLKLVEVGLMNIKETGQSKLIN